jgi:amidase
MTSGIYPSNQLVEKNSDRIGDIDKKGPAINAVIEMNPDAERIAAELDRERKEKGPRGPLHGVPILIKDNLDTADRMMTTAGSLALVGAKPARDSYVAKKLRDAGAVMLGKTNLSEWANFRSTKSSSGWSGRGGQTKKPYVLDRNPCGSSSGSGAAAAAKLCAATIGTETDGSIVCPSSANSLVGIKPTLGKVSGAGIIPIAHSQDTAGPMARTVADAWILFASITEPVLRSTAEFGKDVNIKGLRVGVARKHFGFNERVDKLMDECLAELKRLGAVLVDPADIPTSG